MEINFLKKDKYSTNDNVIFLIENIKSLKKSDFSDIEFEYIKNRIEKQEKKIVVLNRYSNYIIINKIDQQKEQYKTNEKARINGCNILKTINENKIEEVTVISIGEAKEEILSFIEGMSLGNYQFVKYKTERNDVVNTLNRINIVSPEVSGDDLEELQKVIKATFLARNLVNEPLSYLTAIQLAEEFKEMGKEAGLKVEVLNKTKIEALKMGGLLAVNRGTHEEPTFTIMEWNPKNKKNKKPIVLVGKGLVFDTGGVNIKPGNYMNDMKSDMAGGASVAAAIYAIAVAKIPVHVVALIPATENRPAGKAYVPGDVITMHSGLTVEVLNTDAEGRLILADALSYAKKYKPELVIDVATLTGAAAVAVGSQGIVAMGNVETTVFDKLKKSGNNVYERIAEFPFWEEYAEMIKSEVAEIKNVGGSYAGAITAGKFLERFTDYPWIHLDIAGVAFNDKNENYRTSGGTGIPVRLLFDFIKRAY